MTSSESAQSYPLTSIDPHTDPAVAALVSSLVKTQMEDIENQVAAQQEARNREMEEWKKQTAEMTKREDVMKQANAELNAKLATANGRIHSPITSPHTEDSPMPLVGASDYTALSETNTELITSISIPRKRPRKASGPVPDTAPARNTRSRDSQSFNTVMANHTTPVAAAFSTEPLNMPSLPSSGLFSPHVDQWSSTHQAPPIMLPVNALGKLKGKKKAIVKPVAQIHRFLPQDMPDDLGGLKKALALHIRILWALLDAKEVPKDPPAQLLKRFGMKFFTEAELFVSIASGPELIPRHLVQVGTAMSSIEGGIAQQARLVEEHILSYIQGQLSRFGLDRWHPDLRQSAYSLYNAACRIIALDTFKQALVTRAYLHLGPNTAYATNMTILFKLYDHFVFHYMLLRYQRENRNPGTVIQQLKKSPQYERRIRLAAARTKFLTDNKYPKRYRDLIHPEATSDDEYDATEKVYLIKHRPERSDKADKFFRLLDQKRKESAQQDKSQKWRERKRIVPTTAIQQDSPFHVLPEKLPVDYFDPTYFNKLQPKTRNRVAIPKISLLPLVSDSFTWNAEERMGDKAFNTMYRAPVLALYEMISDANLTIADDTDEEWAVDDEDVEEIALPRNDNDIDMTLSQVNLSTHLSGHSQSNSVV